jgi:hypothetical protein
VLATTTTGDLMVWGYNSHGQLGLGYAFPQVWEAQVCVFPEECWFCEKLKMILLQQLRGLSMRESFSAHFMAFIKNAPQRGVG